MTPDVLGIFVLSACPVGPMIGSMMDTLQMIHHRRSVYITVIV